MSRIEYEVRVLEINKEEIQSKLKELNATLIEDVLQKRYVYDFKPVNPSKWIRLRTNGTKSTLTIKNVETSNIDGTKEVEIEVSDFDTTNEILGELGYSPRGIQENKRIKYDLNGVEVDIDTWPRIPTQRPMRTSYRMFTAGLNITNGNLRAVPSQPSPTVRNALC